MNPADSARKSYENRLVAFIDILGFSKLILRSENEPAMVSWMVNILDAIKSNEGLKKLFGKELDLQLEFTAFSDCFVLSTRVPEDPVNTALYQISLTCSLMLRAGLFVRGAIVEGALFHKENIVFGPGLINAYNKEQKEAVYPRITVTSELVERYNTEINVPELDQVANKWTKTLIRQDTDKTFYLDTLFSVPYSLENADEKEHLEMAKIQIKKQIAANQNNPQILKKYDWFKEYFNEIVREHPEYGIENIK